MGVDHERRPVAETPQRSDQPLLVASAPRTGTTWVARALSVADGATLINEPDNEWPNPFALKAKLSLGQYPVLEEGDRAPFDYDRLWERAFAGFRPPRFRTAAARRLGGERANADLWRALCDHAGPRVSSRLRLLMLGARPPSRRDPRAKGPVVVKSVHAPLALGWVAARFRPRVVVVLRHPMNVIASWEELGWGSCALETNPEVRRRFGARWGLPELDPGASRLERVAWQVGLFTCALQAGLDVHGDWVAISHESLSADPAGGFRNLYSQLGLEWTDLAGAFLRESNRPGTGYSTFRVAAEQPGRWRRRLTPEQIREAWSVLSRIEAPWVERIAGDLE